MKDAAVKEKYRLRTVEKALDILDLFYQNETLSPAQAAQMLELNRTTAIRFFSTLENKGLIRRLNGSQYALSLKLFSLGQIAYGRNTLASEAHQYLEKITAEINESSHFSVLDGLTHVVFVDKAVPHSGLKMEVGLGARYKAHNTACGKAILAFQPAGYIRQYVARTSFKAATDNSIASSDALLSQLSVIRENGYSCDDEEAEEGLTCYAVPICGNGGVSVAAISVSGPTTRMRRNKEKIILMLKEAADSLSRRAR